MNVLFVDQFAQLGGAQRCLLDLLPAFQRQDWQLRFAVVDEGPFPAKLRKFGVQVDVLPGCSLSSIHKPMNEALRYLRWYPRAARLLRQIAAEFKPDLLYVNGPRLIPPLALFACRSRTPVLFHAHSRLLQTGGLLCLGAHLRLAKARVVACCRYVGNSLRPYLSPDAIETVYNGVPDMRTAPRPHSKRIPRVGVVGRIEPEKGQLAFVRAARLVYRELPSCHFVVVGAPLLSKSDIYLRQIIEESRGLPITFAGWQSDISCALRDLDVLVVPSLSYDATPRIVMEAFSAGTPVVAFSSGGIPELIENGRTGFLVNTRSPEALARCVLRVLRATDEAVSDVVGNARRKWHADFHIETYQERVCKIVSDTALTP